jgi:hypothetical protein
MSTPSIRSEKVRAGRKTLRAGAAGRKHAASAQIDLEDYLRELSARGAATPTH